MDRQLQAEFERLLRATATDLGIDNDEKRDLSERIDHLDAEDRRFLRNRAFAICREAVIEQPSRTLDALRWLEQLLRTLDTAGGRTEIESSVHFSPGDGCYRKLCELFAGARQTVDICVFTIADDRLTDLILASHRRGLAVRVISDNDKLNDEGSDIRRLDQEGIALRIDSTPFHMHHKFAIFDGRLLANGSFNWTRSASSRNNENLVVTGDHGLLQSFSAHFEALWSQFASL